MLQSSPSTPAFSAVCRRPRRRVAPIGLAVLTASALALGGTAHAAIVPTVGLGTAAEYAVLAGSTVTNTGGSVLDNSLGLSPGTDISGFPPGIVNAPATTNQTNAAAAAAQADLTTAYLDAANRPFDGTTTADLGNQTLQAGVWITSGKGPLGITGPLVLDGAGNFDSVFIFQTDSTLITGSGSTVTLINGAQACRVFWQVGSSATLGTGSTMVGNIMALSSISLNDSVTVNGRALARNGAVTLINDTFTKPSCDSGPTGGTPTTMTTTPGATPTTASGAGSGGDSGGDAGAGGSGTGSGSGSGSASTTIGTGVGLTLPSTGTSSVPVALAAAGVLALGLAARRWSRTEPRRTSR